MSDKKNYMPHVAFNYPQQQQTNTAWDGFLSGLLQQERQKRAEEPYRLPHEVTPLPSPENGRVQVSKEQAAALGNLNYNYTIKPASKNITWLPAAVYNDGVKTYIQFPQTLRSSEAPIFMLLRGNSREMVNYRIVGNTYVVDYLVDRGLLLAGTGQSAQKCLIIKDTVKKSEEPKTHAATTTETKTTPAKPEKPAQALSRSETKVPAATSAGPKTVTGADPIIGILDGIDKIFDPDGKNKKALQDANNGQFTYEKYLAEKAQKKQKAEKEAK